MGDFTSFTIVEKQASVPKGKVEGKEKKNTRSLFLK